MAEDDGSVTAISWERVAKRLELYAFKIAGLSASAGDEEDGTTDYTYGAGVGPRDLASKVLKDFFYG